MEKQLQLAYLPTDRTLAEQIGLSLSESGFDVTLVNENVDPNLLVVVLLTPSSKPEDLFSCFPWLKSQFELSSFKGFRLMPLLAFDPKETDIEKAYEGELGETMEKVFSGEFKPLRMGCQQKGNRPRILQGLGRELFRIDSLKVFNSLRSRGSALVFR